MFLASSIRALSRRVDGLDLQLGRSGATKIQVQEEGDCTEERERDDYDDQLMRRVLSLDERVNKINSGNDERLKIQNILKEEITLPLSTLQREVEREDGVVNSAIIQEGPLQDAAGDLEEVRKRMAVLDNFKVSAVEMKATKDKLEEVEKCIAEIAQMGESQTDRVNQLVDIYTQFVHAMTKKSLEWDAKLRQKGF